MTVNDQPSPQVLRFQQKSRKPVVFDRHELGLLMSLYGRRVAEGEWREGGNAATDVEAESSAEAADMGGIEARKIGAERGGIGEEKAEYGAERVLQRQ